VQKNIVEIMYVQKKDNTDLLLSTEINFVKM